MATKDPEELIKNQKELDYTAKLKALLPTVLLDTGIESVSSLHGKIGHKNEHYIDVRNAEIYSADHFVNLWYRGLIDHVKNNIGLNQSSKIINEYINTYPSYKEYLYYFLKRTYLRNQEAYSKKKPRIEESEIWIGNNNADYGLLVTPRFNGTNWENDKSEIRHFKKKYWTIGHILETGLVIPYKNRKKEFGTAKEYLEFFEDVIVRDTGSIYNKAFAELYSTFVINHNDPENIPLLIPEFRYKGLAQKHKHRLDFLIIEPTEMKKVGIELSPWSSHGQLTIKDKKAHEINSEALQNFEKETNRLRDYFWKYDITTLIYTNSQLGSLEEVFDEFKKFLEPKNSSQNIKLSVFNEFN